MLIPFTGSTIHSLCGFVPHVELKFLIVHAPMLVLAPVTAPMDVGSPFLYVQVGRHISMIQLFNHLFKGSFGFHVTFQMFT